MVLDRKGSEEVQAVSSPVYLKTNTQITVYGNYKDEHSGVNELIFKLIKKIEYSLYSGTSLIAGGDTDNPDADYPLEIKGEQWYISKNDGKAPLGTTEGALRLVVKATENKPEGAAAVTGTREYETTKEVNFYYDKANPELTESGIGTRGKTTNAGFTLSGKAWDTNGLERIEIKSGSQTWTSTSSSNVSLTAATSEPASINACCKRNGRLHGSFGKHQHAVL